MSNVTTKPDSKFLVDVHVYAGAPPGAEEMVSYLKGTKSTPEEVEWMSWRTANEVYKLELTP